MFSTVSGEIEPSEIKSGSGLCATASFCTNPGSGTYETGSSLGASDTKSYDTAASGCGCSTLVSLAPLATGTGGASHGGGHGLAFGASASHGLLLVLNHEFPPLGFAVSCKAASGALATTGDTISGSAGASTSPIR